jgi:hypothetical protein
VTARYHPRMRSALLVCVCGCSLYFGPSQQQQQQPPPGGIAYDGGTVRPPDDAGPTLSCDWNVCRNGIVYHVAPTPVVNGACATPSFTDPLPIETCPYGCELTGFYSDRSANPCATPPPPTYDCTLAGSACSGMATQACGATLTCGIQAQTGECACGSDRHWGCTPACSDGLCSSAAVQQAIVGTWSGTATPVASSFPAGPWHVTLTIGSDHVWTGSTDQAYRDPFYYGGSGGGGDKVFVQAETALGGEGILRVFGGDNDGLVENLHVDATHLSFTWVAAWLNCSFAFDYVLTR